MIEEMDTTVGTVLDKLVELGIDQNTYVIFTSDNGGVERLAESSDNAPLRGEKHSIYEGGIRVPWIVRGPGIAAGSHSDVPVIQYDLLPTVMDVAGVSDPNGVEGTSLLPLWQGQTSSLSRAHGAAGELFWHFPHYGAGNSPDGPRPPGSMIRDGNWKLLRIYDPPGVELYDLSNDLGETNNLAASQPAIVAALEAKLDAWLTATNAAEMRPSGADFDLSGTVDANDLAIWQTNFGNMLAGHAEGDSQGDAAVDGLDFLRWQLGNTTSATSVPEPASGVLALLLLVSTLLITRSHGKRTADVQYQTSS